MTAIETTLYVALGGFIIGIIMGTIGASLDDSKNNSGAAPPFLVLAMFGFGTCGISLFKAGLMALGV